MRQTSVKKNYIYNLIYQVLLLIIPLITTPYVSRVLGASRIGTYSYTASIVSYFVLAANLGSNYYASREVAYNQNNKPEYSKIFWEVIIFRIITTSVCLVIYCLFFLKHSSSIYHSQFLVQTITILAVVFDVSWFFSGLEEFKITVFRNTVVKMVCTIYIFLIVKDADDLNLYILGMVAATLLGNLSFWLLLPKYILKIEMKRINPFRNFVTIIQLFIPYLATQVYTVVDKTMIGLFCITTIENGYYEQSEKIIKLLLTVITTVGTVMVPRFAFLYKNNQKAEIIVSIKKNFRFMWALGIPMCLGMIIISDEFVLLFLGTGFEKCSLLIKIFSVLFLAIGTSNILGTQYLISIGKHNIYTISVVFGAILNVCLNLLLIPHYFSVGAAIASVMAESFIAVFQIIYLSNILPIQELFGLSRNYLFSGILMTIVCFVLNHFYIGGLFRIFLIVCIGGLVYVSVLLVMKDVLLGEVITVLKSKLSGRNQE